MILDMDYSQEMGVFVTLWFAASFLCTVERRRGVVLGKQFLRPSDAFCYVSGGLLRDAGGRDVIVADEVLFSRAG